MLTVLFHKKTHAFVFISLSISSNTAFSERCSKIVLNKFYMKIEFHSHINLSNIGKRKKVRETSERDITNGFLWLTVMTYRVILL